MTGDVFLFDIDGTLIKSGGAGKLAIAATLKDSFSIASPSVNVDFGGRTDLSLISEIFSLNYIENSQANRELFFNSYLCHLQDQLHQQEGEILPGVLPLLESLSERPDSYLGLVTGNCKAGAQLKLSHYDLDHFFKFGGFGDFHELRGEIAQEGLASFHRSNPLVAANRVFVIGDTPADVHCGRHIKAECVAISTGYSSVASLQAASPDFLLPTLESFLSVTEL